MSEQVQFELLTLTFLLKEAFLISDDRQFAHYFSSTGVCISAITIGLE